MQDLILVTVDCWRYDSLRSMPQLGSVVADGSWAATSTITQSSTTSNSFPALFASEYFPRTWETDGGLREGVTTLMAALSAAGYSTGSFVAGNPWVADWQGEFDSFWNGTEGSPSGASSSLRTARQAARLRPAYSAEDVLSRATDWWSATASPRFLWVHLMEPHGPYFPGFRRAMATGPLRAISSYLGAAHYDNDEYPDWLVDHSRRLYRACVKRLDSVLAPWVDRMDDDATIVLTADHGQEFEHGFVEHRRLYDEVLRVPLLTNTEVGQLGTGLTRQLDITPTLLEELDVQSDGNWVGSVSTAEMEPQLLLSSPNSTFDRIWAGIRTADTKIILSYDYEWTLQETEIYDLRADPNELHNLAPRQSRPELVDRIEAFVERPDIREPMNDWHPEVGLLEDNDVEGRLKRLGYLE